MRLSHGHDAWFSACEKLDTFPDGWYLGFFDVLRPDLLLPDLRRIDLLSMRLYDAGDARVRRL
jgi:hypothetical protein